jgi:copper resistance protein B
MKITTLVSTTSVIALTASILLVSAGVMADSEMAHSKMNHADKAMNHSEMDHSKMKHADKAMDHSEMDHSKMNHADKTMNHSEMEHSQMKHADKAMDHSEMEHSQMKHADKAMDHSEMDHSKMNHADKTMDHSEMDHSQMDHGDMKMQGGKAPADARDPHAYSGGYTLADGPYAIGGGRQLILADEHRFYAIKADKLEQQFATDSLAFELQGWYGTTFNRLAVKQEGEVSDGKLAESQTDLLWSRAIYTFWDTQLGARFDTYAEGESRQWLALGIQGLAPYWFEVDVTAYVGNSGRTALAAEAEYELLFTQRLILQSSVGLTAYGKDDAINGIGKGVSSLNAGMRLRYEFSRQFAPYIGVEWLAKYGNSADFAKANNESTHTTSVVAGVRFWF